VAREFGAQPVGLELAAAADRHLHQRGAERGEEHRRNSDDGAPSRLPFWSRPPPKKPPKLASMPIAPDKVAAMVMVSVSRLWTWLNYAPARRSPPRG